MACLKEINSECITFSVALQARLAAVGYTAKTFDDLIMEIVTKSGGNLEAQIKDLRKIVSEFNADTIPAGAKMFGLRSGSVDAVKITNRSVEYSADGEEFTYDFSKLIQELPEDIVYLGARVDVVDDKGKRASIQGKRNNLKVPSIPATATLSLDLKSANGNLTLEKVVYIESDVDKSSILNVRDFTSAPADLTIKGAIEALAAEVALSKR